MINRDEAVIIAAAARTKRPTWDQLNTVNTLLTLDGTFDQVMTHALRTASNPDNRTPHALTFTNPDPPTTTPGTYGGPPCDTCGRTQHQCETVHAKETRHHIPNPHHYRPSR